jgi:hypothetical protein
MYITWHIEHTFCIFPFFVAFFSATIDGRNLIFGHKLYIGTPYRGKRFWTRQIPTCCLPKSGGIISELMLTVHLVSFNSVLSRNKVGKQEVRIWWVQIRFPRYGVPIWSLWPNIRSLPSIVAEKNVTKNVHMAFLDRSDSYFLFANLVGFYTHWTYMHIFRYFFLSNYAGL